MSLRTLTLAAATLTALAAWALPAAAGDTTPDATFVPGSYQPGWDRIYPVTSANEKAVAIARSPDGGYVVCLSIPGGSAGARIGLAWYDANGVRAGEVVKDAYLGSVTDMAIDAQGRIIVVGATPGPGGTDDFGVVRFLPDGSDDTSFAGDGGTSAGFDDTSGAIPAYTHDRPRSVTTDPDGKVVVAGAVFSADYSDVRYGVIRLNADGSYNGRTAGRYAAGQKGVGNKILRLAGGYYLVVGSSIVGTNDTDFGARIIKPDLTTDSGYGDARTFGFDVDNGDGSLEDIASDAALADPTTVVLAGTASDHIAVNRIKIGLDGDGNPAGLTLDMFFVGGGIADNLHNFVGQFLVTGTDTGQGTAPTRVAVRSDGSVMLTGRWSAGGGKFQAMAVRLDRYGVPDFSATEGAVVYRAPMSNYSDSPDTGFTGVMIDAGRPVFVGTSMDNTGDTDGVILRLESDLIFADRFE